MFHFIEWCLVESNKRFDFKKQKERTIIASPVIPSGPPRRRWMQLSKCRCTRVRHCQFWPVVSRIVPITRRQGRLQSDSFYQSAWLSNPFLLPVISNEQYRRAFELAKSYPIPGYKPAVSINSLRCRFNVGDSQVKLNPGRVSRNTGRHFQATPTVWHADVPFYTSK